MFSGIDQTNSVDIVGKDGMVCYGRVVEVTDNGFFVDFLSSERRRFFPFGSNVFLPSWTVGPLCAIIADEYARPDLAIPVEVLMRETPSGPWKWFSAEMVNLARGVPHESYNVAVVRWGTTTLLTDMVLGDRIRQRARSPTDALVQRIQKGTFVNGSTPLPKTYCSMSVEEVRKQMPDWFDYVELWRWSVALVNIADDRLFFIERPPEKRPLSGAGIDGLPENLPTLHDSLMKCFARVICQPHSANAELESQESQGALTALSEEVWLEVFSQLDTLTQNSLRGVCVTFSYLPDSPTLTVEIFITTAECQKMEKLDRREYFVVAPIYKCLNSSTKRIVVADRKALLSESDLWKMLDMIHYVTEQKSSLRRLTLYLQGLRCSFQLGLTYDPEMEHDSCMQHMPKPVRQFNGYTDELDVLRLVDFIPACQKLPCDAIRLLHCTMHVNHTNGWPDANGRHSRITSSLTMTRSAQLNNLGCAMWEALEMGMPEPTLEQREKLAQWLAGLGAAAGGHLIISVACKTLCAMQTADPRKTLHYRGKRWCTTACRIYS
ncbi:uncharacterized protein LOC129595777 [Paramacrobiotus metropolitanus]|uniref:uncharacterized protein LOC129595777 n=1 Tax=Paramacrobiotus metropolitanus TaxID=2943436 RepID=UPI002445ED4E|nr:uncharacterized protein LOC129595777 [Paramacrobiotus metropolitanus]